MKKFKELTEGLSHKVPVYHADRKTLVGHVSSGATSIGAAKLAKKKSAIFSRVNGEYSWVASGDLKESKYGDAMSSRLPAHLDDPTHDNYGRSNYGKTRAKQPAPPKPSTTRKPFDYTKFSADRAKNPHKFIAGLEESTWQAYRAAVLMESAELNIPEHTTQEIANKHGVTIQHIEAQLEKGIKVEGEHTTHLAPAREIALDHLWENPNYYTILRKAQLEGCLLEEGTTFSKAIDKMLDRQPPHAFTQPKRKRDRLPKNTPMYVKREKDLQEELTPREKMSTDERLKPIKPAPVDQSGKEKQALIQHDKTNDTVQKRFSQGGSDAGSKQALRSLKESDIAFNESGAADHLSKFSHHWAQFKLHDNLSDTDRTHLTQRNYHEQEMNKHYKNLTTRQKNDLRLQESSGSEEYKVGDKVVAKIGPHKGTVHTVIHVHPTGHLNIKPDVHVRSNRYHLGAAKADPKDVTRASLKEEYSQGMYFHAAVKHAKQHGNRVTFGTASKKWHSIDPKDRDYHTSFALDPDEAARQGEAKSFLHSTASRHLEEATRRTYYANMQKKDPAKFVKNRGKQFKKNISGLQHLDLGDEADRSFEKQERARGINRKTIQEIFQAAKDKKNGKTPQIDALPNDGANEPNKEVPGVQPQDAKGPKDGAPGTEKKKDNTPVPENPNKSKKMQVKGAGPDDKFQPDPIVTPLTTMPDTASPKSGSQGVR